MTTEATQPAEKTILLLFLGDLFKDTRTNRLLRLLNQHYHVIATGSRKPHVYGVQYVRAVHTPLNLKGKLNALWYLATRQYEAYSWRRTVLQDLSQKLAEVRPDLVIVCDVEALPAGLKLAQERGAKLICDLPDYPPQRVAMTLNEQVLYPPAYWEYLCRTYLPRADVVITSSHAMARLQEQHFGIMPVVLPNASDYVDTPPNLRTEQASDIRLAFRGEALSIHQRNYADLFQLMGQLDDCFTLDMLMTTRGLTHRDYGQKLEQQTQETPRVRFQSTQALQPLFLCTHEHDVALWLHEPHNENQRSMLPEVVFDYIQARLPLVTTPQQPEVATLVQEYGCGVVASDSSVGSLASTLQGMDHRTINRLKQQTHERARELSFEAHHDQVLSFVEQTLS